MVLSELREQISDALSKLSNSQVVDERALQACLNGINTALLQADVSPALLTTIKTSVTNQLRSAATGHDKPKLVRDAVCQELCRLLGGEVGAEQQLPGSLRQSASAHKRRKGPAARPSVVMLVGLQGAGKTTTATKYARYYHNTLGLRPSLVCADTFRAGAFDQLKQNACKLGFPCFGSYTETDPAEVARAGVQRFRDEGLCDLIIVDTSGRHRQDGALFEEMRQLADVVRPDLTVLVMDASIGQAAYGHALAFKQSVAVGAVIITKMDGSHAKGGGALSAVAATKSPIIFLATREHMHQFEPFDAKQFVGRLLGMGDWQGLLHKVVRDVLPTTSQMDGSHDQELLLDHHHGFTLRALHKLYDHMLQMGPNLKELASLLPHEFSSKLSGLDSHAICARLKRFMIIMDSMTSAELDSPHIPKLLLQSPSSRMERIARGSGCSVQEIKGMMEHFKHYSTMYSKKGLISKLMSGCNIKGGGHGRTNITAAMSTLTQLAAGNYNGSSTRIRANSKRR